MLLKLSETKKMAAGLHSWCTKTKLKQSQHISFNHCPACHLKIHLLLKHTKVSIRNLSTTRKQKQTLYTCKCTVKLSGRPAGGSERWRISQSTQTLKLESHVSSHSATVTTHTIIKEHLKVSFCNLSHRNHYTHVEVL